jgi:hypothetical protein
MILLPIEGHAIVACKDRPDTEIKNLFKPRRRRGVMLVPFKYGSLRRGNPCSRKHRAVEFVGMKAGLGQRLFADIEITV